MDCASGFGWNWRCMFRMPPSNAMVASATPRPLYTYSTPYFYQYANACFYVLSNIQRRLVEDGYVG